ncbi:c-type cytochrome biogenesis protein CcmI/CycH [Parahaliea aestuarii]|uniref:Cytochrome C biogenesis protein n=1 Tax=Parahaliea aestuarii TaxID=1852021 RepID=A0A5C8ZT48_9GAMM|nr:cytochrome C biogenesis protein [Parahaliea aestuarii]TXS90939.1 cytochrome C biogenesis protein [Parahaliea aestuarii]
MTTFILACAGLVLLSGLFYLFPSRRGSGARELERANFEWYRLRQRELAEGGDEALDDDARLRLMEEEQARAAAKSTPLPESQRFPAWLLLPLVAVAAFGLYYTLGAAPDVLLNERLKQLNENATATEVYSVMSAVEARSAQRPDNLHYKALLGRYYMGQEEYARAAETYTLMAEEAPEDAYALAYAAQARYLAAGRVLDDESQRMAEASLAINPHQRTALGLLGMVSFEQGQYRAAIQYWERLRATEQPGSESDRMIAGVIGQAQERLGEAPESGVEAAPVAQADSEDTSVGVTVRVSLPEGADVNPDDTVFVLARNPGSGSRMPIAVQRLSAAQLPVTLRLDDSHSMAGQKISTSDEVVVMVQVSPTGQPGESNASWLGEGGPLQPSASGEALQIELSPRRS